MAFSGTLLRLECYRRLEGNFTLELAVKQDHKLITDGPYAVVRHPSYTGAMLILIGGILVLLGRGSWVTERMWRLDHVSLLGPVLGRVNWLAVAYASVRLSVSWMLFRRCAVEDEVLKAHFQDEWVRWAQKVPYRLVPYIY